MPDWATTLLTAFFAVVIGGMLTYLAQMRLEDRRAANERERDEGVAERERERDAGVAERERKREEAAAAAELRVAIRLLLEELDTIALHHDMLIEAGHYPQPLDPALRVTLFPTAAWEADKRTLAGALADDRWDAVATTLHTMARTRDVVFQGKPLQPLPPELLAQLDDGKDIVSGVYELLAGKPPPSLKNAP